jgi:hypothetical protein
MSSLPRFARLASLNLEPAKLKRLRFDLTFYFEVVNNSTPFDPNEMFIIHTSILSSGSGSSYLLKPVKASNIVFTYLILYIEVQWRI